MDGDSGIDPQLRDSFPSTQPPQDHRPPAVTTLTPTRSTPTTTQPPPFQALQSPPQGPFPNWPQDGAYQQYYTPHPGQQPGVGSTADGFQQSPLAPGSAPPATQYTGARGVETKRLRACEACRGLKVRCEPDPNGGPCKRCMKANRQCTITAPSRKRQKKTDSRVAELERRIDDLQKTMHFDTPSQRPDAYAQPAPYPNMIIPPSGPSGAPLLDLQSTHRRDDIFSQLSAAAGQTHPVVVGQKREQQEATAPTIAGSGPESANVERVRNSIDPNLAKDLYDYYINNLLPKFPIVTLPADEDANSLRKGKPTLFGVLMLVVSKHYGKDLGSSATTVILNDLAEKIFNGEKSIELINSLQLLAIWHVRSEDWSFVHLCTQNALVMAGAMAIDRPGQANLISKSSLLEANPVERARMFIGCYCMKSATNFNKQQAEVFGSVDWVEECKATILSSTNAYPNDSRMCDFADQQVEAAAAFAHVTEDPKHANSQALSIASDEKNKTREVNRNLFTLFCLESAQYLDKSPPTKSARGRGKPKAGDAVLDSHEVTEQYIRVISEVVSRLKELAPPDLRTLPGFRYIQIAHAYTYLIRLSLITESQGSADEAVVNESKDIAKLISDIHATLGAASSDIPAAEPLSIFKTYFRLIDNERVQKQDPTGDRKDGDATASGNNQAETEVTDSQGLHLLSELATINRGSGAGDKTSKPADPKDPSVKPTIATLLDVTKTEDGRWGRSIDDRLIERVFGTLGREAKG